MSHRSHTDRQLSQHDLNRKGTIYLQITLPFIHGEGVLMLRRIFFHVNKLKSRAYMGGPKRLAGPPTKYI